MMSWLLVVVAIGLFFGLRVVMKPYHVYSLIVHKNYESVWRSLSDPLQYKELYPHWIKDISYTSGCEYMVYDQFSNIYPMQLSVNQEYGVVNLHIGQETSQLRLFQLDSSSTLIVHVAKQWQGINTLRWFFHKRTVAKDFCHAKSVLEQRLP